ncbi:hypothetical protein [Marinitoga sp. 1155]|uniref:hypothetical protein n=1 Tax=Marinitoga sp. 1155 TaxID=1428448 RepID=UPI0006416A32|nr:hypothetical protein [Marinitoga sp. 1155]KLO24147.1 hypothetical protein X274_04455 [Marinitoga sp. 1155]
MKKFLYLFFIILIISLLLSACIKDNKVINENNNLNISRIIDISFNDNVAVVTSKVTADSFEFLITNVSPDKIEIPSMFMNIVKEKEDKLLVAISTINFVNAGDVLLTIKANNFNIEKIDYFSRNTLTKQYNDFDPYNWKWGGLLGDFNLSGKVDLTDFSSFVYYYGMNSCNEDVPDEFSRFDIGPALNIVNKGNWKYVYDYKLEDWQVNIIDFSIFTANYGYSILESPSGTIVLNSNIDITSISTPAYNDVLTVLKSLPDEIHNINDIFFNHKEYIESLMHAITNNNFQNFILNLINIPENLEESLINIIEDLGVFSQKLSINDYLDENIKWEINDFDWNGDGIIDNNTELHIAATVTYYGQEPQKGSFGLYTDILLKLDDIDNIDFIGIDKNTPGDAIFDWEFLTKKLNYEDLSDYSLTFDENDYLIVDEGLISMMAFIFNNIYVHGSAFFLYDLNNPSATITSILQSDSLEASLDELFLTLASDYTITASEMENNIFGEMLKPRDDFFETRVASIQNSIFSQKDIIRTALEDSIIDYLPQEHDITSGPFEIFNIWDIYSSNFSELFTNDINIPIHIFGPIMIYPAVFFENPEDFKDLSIYLPDITLEGTIDSKEIEKIIIDFPDPYFNGLISGIENPLIISTIDFNQNMQKPQIINYEMEGITRIRPDDDGIPTSELALRFDVNISNPESVQKVEVWKNDEYITDLYYERDNYYFNEELFDVITLNFYEDANYTVKVYNYNNEVVDSKTLYLGKLYPENSLEITSPYNFSIYTPGENITLQWNNNLNLPYEGAEINIAKINEITNMVDWENRKRVADDYVPDTPNFSITDLSYNIPANIFESSGMYLIELVIYNWSENTSFEYHTIIGIQ